MRRIYHGENLAVLSRLPAGFARLLYLDPPFNTGRAQSRARLTAHVDATGGRRGFGGKLVRTRPVVGGAASASFDDAFDDHTAYVVARVEAALRCLTPDASIFVHLDPREVHYAKVALDRLLGRSAFVNEIIWAYDYGGRPRDAWPRKHDTILYYARDPKTRIFDREAMDRIPYMAPGLVGPEKAARGKLPTDVWWHTIVPTSGKEKTGYPTQKPLGVLERIVKVCSREGDVVLDCFAGSGTTGEAAAKHGRGFVMIDESADAVAVMRARLARFAPEVIGR